MDYRMEVHLLRRVWLAALASTALALTPSAPIPIVRTFRGSLIFPSVLPMNPTRRSLLAGLSSVAALALAASLGCQVFDMPPQAALDQFLTPVTTSPDSVTLEIFHARIPLDKEGAADAIWDQIDEQRFD